MTMVRIDSEKWRSGVLEVSVKVICPRHTDSDEVILLPIDHVICCIF